MTKLIMLGAAGLLLVGFAGYSQFAVQPASSNAGCSATSDVAMMSDAACSGGSCCSSSEMTSMVASSCCSEGSEMSTLVASACCSESGEAATMVAGACCTEGECPVDVCPADAVASVAASGCCEACEADCGCCDEGDCTCAVCESNGSGKSSEAADAAVVAEVE